MEQQTAGQSEKCYEINGRRFYVAPIVARQEQWLWPILRPIYLQGDGILGEQILSLLVEHVTRVAAILLIPEGMTQADKCLAGLRGVDELQAWLDSATSLEAIAPVLRDFFTSGQVQKITRGIFGLMAAAAAPATTGSSAPSASWPMGTSSGPTGSGVTSDSPRPGSISSDSKSAERPISPSAPSPASSCPG